MDCPRCGVALRKSAGALGIHFGCRVCNGRLVATPVVRKATSDKAIAALLARARESQEGGAACPVCRKQMAEVVCAGPIQGLLDVCTRCQFLWFDKEPWADVDAERLETRHPRPDTTSTRPLPPEAVIELSRIKLRQAHERGAADVFAALSQIPGAPIGRPLPLSATPVTWFLAAVTLLVYAKTTQYNGVLFDILSLSPTDPWRFMGITFLTAPLIHGGLTPLLVGLVVLILVGRPCEDAGGSARIAAVLVVGAVLGGFVHLISGTEQALHGNAHVVSALVTFFSVRFPSARIPYLHPYFSSKPQNRWMWVNVWILFIAWLVTQSIYALCGWSYVSVPAVFGGATVGAVMAFAVKAAGGSRKEARDRHRVITG